MFTNIANFIFGAKHEISGDEAPVTGIDPPASCPIKLADHSMDADWVVINKRDDDTKMEDVMPPTASMEVQQTFSNHEEESETRVEGTPAAVSATVVTQPSPRRTSLRLTSMVDGQQAKTASLHRIRQAKQENARVKRRQCNKHNKMAHPSGKRTSRRNTIMQPARRS
ncbi:PREDICTED: uncharacterized protein LOC106816359 [Priapulus caudatus]|uniref:Uncharacterized protein LOC106816359 n=1 Tax=Priapulus caudatus TaxID=37621 RepID=A0ABM1EW59_PRICU|nr:PREDICTED: uncharacterized protein LOC106816359 [Priapulus caudatus]